jgi:4-amino-4-deoxy-L-arabinose transferase-like glycosyltransferase
MLQRAERPSRPPRPEERPRPRPGPWLLIFATGLLLRVLCAWIVTGPGAAPAGEARAYDGLAWNLARDAGFALGDATGVHPTAALPPLGPWVASLAYRAVGHDPFAAALLQCAIGALIPLLVAGLGGAVFGGSIGRFAGWLAAFDPLLVVAAGRLESATPFAALLLLGLLASVAWMKASRRGRALGAGLTWGLAALAGPAALLLPLLVAAWAWVPLGLTVPARERARQIAMLLLGLLLAVGPWSLRNALALGRFVPIATAGERAPLAARFVGLDPLFPWSLVTLPLAVWGLARTLTGPRRWFQSLGLLVVLFFTAHTLLVAGGTSPRVPVEPLVALFAAVGFHDARRRLRFRGRGLRVVESGR